MNVKRACSIVLAGIVAFPLLGQPAGTERRVNTDPGFDAEDAVVAWNSAAGFVVVFANGAQYGEVYGRRFSTLGALLGAEFRVTTYTSNGNVNPAVARSSDGRFVVVWQNGSHDGSESGIFAQRFGAGGGPIGSELRVNTYTTNDQFEVAVAASPNGSFVVVWTSSGQESPDREIFGQRFDTNGLPLGDEFRVNAKTESDQDAPVVAMNGLGGFAVVWNDGTTVHGQRFDAGGAPLGGEVELVADAIPERRLRIAGGAGGFVITYERTDGSYSGIYARRHGPDGALLAAEFRVNTDTTGYQQDAALTMEPSGAFVVTWTNGDSPALDVFGQRFRSSGSPVGGAFRINTYTTERQRRSAVAAGPTGRFVVAWESRGQNVDASLDSVYSQRFLAIVGPRGDANGDGAVTVSDVLYLINHLFAGGAPPVGPSDVNGDESVTVSDVLYLINHLFAGGPPPS